MVVVAGSCCGLFEGRNCTIVSKTEDFLGKKWEVVVPAKSGSSGVVDFDALCVVVGSCCGLFGDTTWTTVFKTEDFLSKKWEAVVPAKSE